VLRTDPDGRATHKQIRTHWDPGDQVPFDYQVKFDQATHASTVVRIVIDFPSDYGPTGNDAEMRPPNSRFFFASPNHPGESSNALKAGFSRQTTRRRAARSGSRS
jgi:hypothetical protein